MIKIIAIQKGKDEINVTDTNGQLLLNIRIAESAQTRRADLSIKACQPDVQIVRTAIGNVTGQRPS